MKAKVYSQAGEVKKEMKLSPHFELNDDAKNFAEYINYVRANMRAAVANSKDRSEVSGGGKKPWRQKGTGRARHGSSRSPIWIGGGVTFGPSSDRNFKQRMNKKTRAKYISSILSYFAREKKLVIVDSLNIKDSKTKNAEAVVEKLKLEGKISLILGRDELEAKRSFKNLPYVFIMNKSYLDMINLISSDCLVMTSEAYEEMTKVEKKSVSQNENLEKETKDAK